MKYTQCSICNNNSIPQNDSVKIEGIVYCVKCAEETYTTEDSLKDKRIEKELDPTICSQCNSDFENEELKKISSYPICNHCEKVIKNKTFPLWVKTFFIALLALVIFAFFWNWKYYKAYSNMQQAYEYFQNRDFSNAYALMRSASEKVPEVGDLKVMAAYFNGVDLLRKDKNSDALSELEKCRDKLPSDFDVQLLIIRARIGKCFDNKDYEGFLAATKENLAIDTINAISWASVASAYSCLYIDSGNADFLFQTNIYLNRAKSIDDTSADMSEYYSMIEYRLFSKQIITREDFNKQFPNGWTKN